ncbi:MAG TPA: glycosyltransferase [Blastocatellia bacterium]|nr:glycosyltransferase [Blastocatellia bacterium]
MIALFFALGVLLLLCSLHPFVTYPVSLMMIRLRRGRARIVPSAASREESIAVCFCAFNEESVIEAKMRNLLHLRHSAPHLEVLVYVDAASDRTADLLRPFAGQIKLHISPERRGKTYGMNLLVEMAEASIVVFTDANVMLDSAALSNLCPYFADSHVGCVCGHLTYTNAAESAIAATGAHYWRLEERIKQLESDTGSVIGAHGSIFAVRRRLRRPVPDDVIDDLHVSLSILCDGYRVVHAPDVRAYERALTTSADEFNRKVRIACQAFNVHRLLWPRLRHLDKLSLYKYVSHKLMRWLSVYMLVLATICFVGGLIVAQLSLLGFILVALGTTTLYLGRRWRLGFISYLWGVFSALVATGVGVWLSLRGERFQTWTPGSPLQR